MDIRRFRALHEAGAVTYAEIAAGTGCDWRTVKKYLAQEGPAAPPAPGSSRKGTQPRMIEPFTQVIDSWLRAGARLRASVIFERLAAQYGFGGSYQRVKLYVAEARPRIAAEREAADGGPAAGLHRRFGVLPGAQAQVDWGEETGVLIGTPEVCSFHMTLSYSRDTFCCYTARIERRKVLGGLITEYHRAALVGEELLVSGYRRVLARHKPRNLHVLAEPGEVSGIQGDYRVDSMYEHCGDHIRVMYLLAAALSLFEQFREPVRYLHVLRQQEHARTEGTRVV